MADREPPGSVDETHPGAARLTGDQVEAINRFPDDNPNPVLRFDDDGHLIYANPASAGVLKALGVSVGERLPAEVRRALRGGGRRPRLRRVRGRQTGRYAVWPVPIPDLAFTNLYGMDVTAERAIVKFPDQNPNPVFRIDWQGTLVYANPASSGLIAGLGVAVGECLTDDAARRPPRARPRRRPGRRSRSTSGGAIYALLPVDVPEFGFINVYGTDITAVREAGTPGP